MSGRRARGLNGWPYLLPVGLPGAVPEQVYPVAPPTQRVGAPERNPLARASLGWQETRVPQGRTVQLLQHDSDEFRTLAFQATRGTFVVSYELAVDGGRIVTGDYTVNSIGVALPVGAGKVIATARCTATGGTAGGTINAVASFGAPLVYEQWASPFLTPAASLITVPTFATSVMLVGPDAGAVTLSYGLSTYTAQAGTNLRVPLIGNLTISMTSSVAAVVPILWTIRR